jgi:hypothetical protein
VTVVEQTVEDRGGEDLVAGQDLGPVTDALVGRDQDAAAPLAVGDQPEEQARLLAAHHLEAHLVDDHERHAVGLASTEARRWQLGVALERERRPFETEEGD